MKDLETLITGAVQMGIEISFRPSLRGKTDHVHIVIKKDSEWVEHRSPFKTIEASNFNTIEFELKKLLKLIIKRTAQKER